MFFDVFCHGCVAMTFQCGQYYAENLGRFHHAVTQTAPIQKKDVHIIRFHREAGKPVFGVVKL